jgi:hypothetical protein
MGSLLKTPPPAWHAPPPKGFDAAAAAAALNVSSVANVGDPSVLNQAAASIASLASFGLSEAANSSDEDKGRLRAVVDTQGAALLVASAAAGDARDPEAAQTAAFSAAGIFKVRRPLARTVPAMPRALACAMHACCRWPGPNLARPPACSAWRRCILGLVPTLLSTNPTHPKKTGHECCVR